MSPKKPPAPTESQQEFLARLQQSYEMMMHGQDSAAMTEDALRKLDELRQLIDMLKQRMPDAAEKAEFLAPPDTLSFTWREFEALFSFYEEAVAAIQQARHSVRFKQPLTEEPKYPRDRALVLGMIRRVLMGLRTR